MGDSIAGGSVYWLSDNVDGGPIAAQDWCHVHPTWDASFLWRKLLFPMGIRLLRRVLDDLERHVIVEIPQDEGYATWEPSWERPPLFRPDLPQIGGVPGYQHITRKVT
jgi:methionyl-tRNA formyltransferase